MKSIAEKIVEPKIQYSDSDSKIALFEYYRNDIKDIYSRNCNGEYWHFNDGSALFFHNFTTPYVLYPDW